MVVFLCIIVSKYYFTIKQVIMATDTKNFKFTETQQQEIKKKIERLADLLNRKKLNILQMIKSNNKEFFQEYEADFKNKKYSDFFFRFIFFDNSERIEDEDDELYQSYHIQVYVGNEYQGEIQFNLRGFSERGLDSGLETDNEIYRHNFLFEVFEPLVLSLNETIQDVDEVQKYLDNILGIEEKIVSVIERT